MVWTARRLSSDGQSNALVMRRSRVRIPKAAPWETPGQSFDLGFLVSGDLGIRASRALAGYASQCVGLRSTVSGRFASQGGELAFCSVPPVGIGLAGSVRWPCGGQVCSDRANRSRSAVRSQVCSGPHNCVIRTISRSTRSVGARSMTRSLTGARAFPSLRSTASARGSTAVLQCRTDAGTDAMVHTQPTELAWSGTGRGSAHGTSRSWWLCRRLAVGGRCSPRRLDGNAPADGHIRTSWHCGRLESGPATWPGSRPHGAGLWGVGAIRLAKIRWRVERDYRELEHGLGSRPNAVDLRLS